MSVSGDILSHEALSFLCNCINNTVNLSKDIVLDTAIQTSSTYSSFLIENKLKQLKEENETYANSLVAGLNKLSKEVINDKSLVTQENILYLYKSDDDTSNNYMQMMLINGVSVELGTTEVDISTLYSKDECDSKFGAKLDLDTLTTSFNDLKTKVTSHTSDTDIHITTAERDKWNSYNTTINEMKTNFQDGVNTIYDSVVARGVTPTDKSPSSIVEALDKTFNNSILIKEYSSDGLKPYDNRGIIEEGGYYKDEKYKICYVNVIYLPKVDISSNAYKLIISGLPMPLIQNDYTNPTFLSIENIDNPNRQNEAGYGIDIHVINGCIFMTPFNNNERVRIYGAYQYSES